MFLQPGDTVNLRVPVERNGFSESFTLEPVEYTQGALCRLPSEPIEDNNIRVLVAASEDASEGKQTQKIKTIIFGREVFCAADTHRDKASIRNGRIGVCGGSAESAEKD